MTLTETKQLLITKIEEELRDININYEQGYEDGKQLDIPFMIAPFYQVESNKVLFHVLKDLQERDNNYALSYEKDFTKGSTYGKIIIYLEKIFQMKKNTICHI